MTATNSSKTARWSGTISRLGAVLVCFVFGVGPVGPPVGAAEPGPTASTNAPPKLTERDYYLEELKLAEELVQREETLARQGRGAPERILSAKRGLVSLRRQLAAYDERNKPPVSSFEKQIQRRQAEEKAKTEEQKRQAEERDRQLLARKQELLTALLQIAQKDPDQGVRCGTVNAINRLGLEASLEPLRQLVLKDPDSNVRAVALNGIGAQANEAALRTVLQLCDEVTENSQKLTLIGFLRVRERQTNAFGGVNQVQVVPPLAAAKLTELARASSSRDLRRAALNQLNQVRTEEVTSTLIDLYATCGDSELKQVILHLLGGRGDDSKALRKLLEIARTDSDPRARQNAVEYLGQSYSNTRSPGSPLPPPLGLPPGLPGGMPNGPLSAPPSSLPHQ